MPVRPNSKKPALLTWEHLQTQAAPEEILLQWASQAPTCGIAIVCGTLSDLIVIDDDRSGKPPNREADDFIETLSRLPTAVARTKKGRHFYFRLPRDTNSRPIRIENKVGFLPGLDVRAEGGYVLAPPSPHPDGFTYVWEREPEDGILELPSWALEAITRGAAADGPKAWELAVAGVPEGSRDSSAASILGRWLSLVPEEQWNTDVWPRFVAWNADNKPPLTDAEMQKTWTSITKRERGKRKASTVFPTVQREMPPTITAAELDLEELEVPGFAIKDFILDGATKLFGKPKAGKSYLNFQCAIAVAVGRPLFPMTASMYAYANHPGGFETHQGDVLYLALEDSLLRIQTRMRQIWGGPKPDNMTIATEWWSALDGGLSSIENWIKSVSNPRFIGIDTAAAFFGEPTSKGSVFRAEYRMYRPVWELAQRFKVPIVLVDHASKGKGKGGSGDPFDSDTGTLGGQAVVDTTMVLEHDDKLPRARLHIKGREVERGFFDLEHGAHDPIWKVAGPLPPSEEKTKTGRASKNGALRVVKDALN